MDSHHHYSIIPMTLEFSSRDWQNFFIKHVTSNIYREANVRILSWCYMSFLSTLAISVVSDLHSAECFIPISHSVPVKAVVLGSMVWSALIKRNGTVHAHFVRLLDYDRL
jgi:hypothetical protein